MGGGYEPGWLAAVGGLVLVLAGVSLGAAEAADTGIRAVWAVNDGEKIRREDTANGNREKNSVWDGQAVQLSAAKNEVVAFQVIVSAGAAGAAAVDVQLEKLSGPAGRTLTWKPTPKDPTDWRGREIERFSEHYLQIEHQTNPGWFYTAKSKPQNVTGWLPDALVPDSAGAGRGGFPLAVAANQNQGVWFDIYVPKDAPAGAYTGTVKVTAGGAAVKELPVTLTVHNFALPDENHFRAMICFGEDQLAARHGANTPGLTAEYHRLAHRHRVEFVSAYGPNAGQPQLDRLSGAAFKAESGYVGPGEGIGNVIVPASFYGCGADWKNDNAWKTADSFMTWLNQTKPGAITFLYIIDEPPKEKFAEIKAIGDKHHANPGAGKGLPMFVTHGPVGGLEGAIDVWCTVTDQYSVDGAKEQAAKGRRWWVYNGQRPAAGTELTDAPAIDPRVTPVACHKYGIELWFYWMANQWRHNSQHKRGDQNVWVDPVTFGGNGGCNGDGVLIYAGEDKKYPEQDRGVAGPIASIRLKNIRRGMQDVEYLWLAEQAGLAAAAKAAQDTWVPKAFSEARGNVAWSEAGSDWDAVRARLAAALAQKK